MERWEEEEVGVGNLHFEGLRGKPWDGIADGGWLMEGRRGIG
jgi:hypothetical protein